MIKASNSNWNKAEKCQDNENSSWKSTWTRNCIMKLFAKMFNNLKHTYKNKYLDSGWKLRLQITMKISKEIGRFRMAADSHPRYSKPSEVLQKFRGSLEDFRRLPKISQRKRKFGQISKRWQTAFRIVWLPRVVFRCKSMLFLHAILPLVI